MDSVAKIRDQESPCLFGTFIDPIQNFSGSDDFDGEIRLLFLFIRNFVDPIQKFSSSDDFEGETKLLFLFIWKFVDPIQKFSGSDDFEGMSRSNTIALRVDEISTWVVAAMKNVPKC
ncbi:uncharacterized protein LOC111488172 [Cucurbita maxima]|uniref:Uncharacterized protein LOC111488172 n=1 Tax=Cucurbita maxima TaxID=3661 RepID=A0A6J1JTF3_CUCMA|nr:uncharacterized protein LOC111488172 [Cucurbita maxima]